MRIAHVATDEVNQSLAAQWAAKCGAIICHPRPGEVHPDGLFDAVLYHRDDVPRDQRPAFLEELCLGTRDCPSAVHGYGIADEQGPAPRPPRSKKSRLSLSVPVRVADIPREDQSAPPASRPVRPCVSGPSEVGRYWGGGLSRPSRQGNEVLSPADEFLDDFVFFRSNHIATPDW
jgi:hypothetical protein